MAAAREAQLFYDEMLDVPDLQDRLDKDTNW